MNDTGKELAQAEKELEEARLEETARYVEYLEAGAKVCDAEGRVIAARSGSSERVGLTNR